MRITLCARSKILQLLDAGKSFRIQATGSYSAGSHVDLIPNAEVLPTDCIICHTPLVIADLQTATLLIDQVVDFDYDAEEFIIANRGNE